MNNYSHNTNVAANTHCIATETKG